MIEFTFTLNSNCKKRYRPLFCENFRMIAAIIFYCVLFRQAAITLAHNYSSVIPVYLQPRSVTYPQVGLTTFHQHSISYAQSLQSARFHTYRGKRAGKRKQRPIETITFQRGHKLLQPEKHST